MSDAGSPLDLRAARRRTDRMMLQLALMLANGEIRTAAQLLGITRPSLYDLMALHGFGLPRASRPGQSRPLRQPRRTCAPAGRGMPHRGGCAAAVIDQDSASQPGETYTVMFRGTLAACEDWVAERETIEPDAVQRGRYGIDANQGVC